jgi:SAM-dependent methyltransferase
MAEIADIIQKELDKDGLRSAFLEFTRKAFSVLELGVKPNILDIGCGTGLPTIELAKMSTGSVTGLDIDEKEIEKLRVRINREQLSNRVTVFCCSLFDMDFADGSFDIIWAEGVISVIGFKAALEQWRKLLKPQGYLVVHDDEEGAERKRKAISDCGFILIKEFRISRDIWRERYFIPLEERIDHLSMHYRNSGEAMRILEKEREEAERFGSAPHGSIFFVMQQRRGANGGKGEGHRDHRKKF